MSTISDFFEDIQSFVADRMQKPLSKLLKQDVFRKKKEDYDSLYNMIYCNLGKELKNRLEDLVIENDTIHSDYEILYFIVGFMDGIKFSNKFNV